MPGDETLHPTSAAMTTIIAQPPYVEMDFTDAALVGTGGWCLLARMARQTGLLQSLQNAVRLKRRQRGASDSDMLWSLIASLAAGNGALSDLDALRADAAGQTLLGLSESPSSRRLGEYLGRLGTDEVSALRGVTRQVAQQVAPAVIDHYNTTLGYVPVFVDGTAIEVDGRLFECAHKGYNGEPQLWLHNVFVGGLWASGQLHPGGVDVAKGWQTQLAEDVAPLLPGGTPVWLRADNAYYRVAELVRRHRGKQGQENAFKGPLIEMGLHHPPCRRFTANQAFYACGQIAQLLLLAMQYQWLPVPARRHGLRPLIRYLMRSVGRLVKTGRRYRLDFAKSNFKLDWLLHAVLQLE